jgi:hypothetical protein
MHPATRDPRCRREKRESRCSKKKKRERREKKKEEEGRNPPSRPANSRRPTSAGSRRPWVCETQVFFSKGFAPARGGGVRFESRFFSIDSGCRKDLAIALSHLAATSQQVDDRPPRPCFLFFPIFAN